MSDYKPNDTDFAYQCLRCELGHVPEMDKREGHWMHFTPGQRQPIPCPSSALRSLARIRELEQQVEGLASYLEAPTL